MRKGLGRDKVFESEETVVKLLTYISPPEPVFVGAIDALVKPVPGPIRPETSLERNANNNEDGMCDKVIAPCFMRTHASDRMSVVDDAKPTNARNTQPSKASVKEESKIQVYSQGEDISNSTDSFKQREELEELYEKSKLIGSDAVDPQASKILSVPPPKPPDQSVAAGENFAFIIVNLGEIEICEITEFEFVWNSNMMMEPSKVVPFYKLVRIPYGFYILGHYCQPSNKPLWGFVLKKIDMPIDSTAYFWLPHPPRGYKALGYLVTNIHDKPNVDEISCVRVGLTDTCEPYHTLLDTGSFTPEFPFWIGNLRPCNCNMLGAGVSVGNFFCNNFCWNKGEELPVVCLKNLNQMRPAMPQINQLHALIELYGPTVFFHPEEVYLPFSVDWLFNNGSILYRKGLSKGEVIDEGGSNFPGRGTNDREFWIELPYDDIRREFIKHGDLESAKLYVHEKPIIGGTFNDIVMWIFCLFNGSSILEFGIKNMAFSKVGSHLDD
ncbi:hypothetical protein At1g04090-like [Vicia villosa]|uniref:hypothetical protein At1g04090-like n=1 Tax=Vicia villosa TaxID=3911 RepID=UPI00273B1ADD|nr:hypothetical protein At1g04090-like [Vicia villosa]